MGSGLSQHIAGLELHEAKVARFRMLPARVGEALNEVEDVGVGFVAGAVNLSSRPFGLQHCEAKAPWPSNARWPRQALGAARRRDKITSRLPFSLASTFAASRASLDKLALKARLKSISLVHAPPVQRPFAEPVGAAPRAGGTQAIP